MDLTSRFTTEMEAQNPHFLLFRNSAVRIESFNRREKDMRRVSFSPFLRQALRLRVTELGPVRQNYKALVDF